MTVPLVITLNGVTFRIYEEHSENFEVYRQIENSGYVFEGDFPTLKAAKKFCTDFIAK